MIKFVFNFQGTKAWLSARADDGVHTRSCGTFMSACKQFEYRKVSLCATWMTVGFY